MGFILFKNERLFIVLSIIVFVARNIAYAKNLDKDSKSQSEISKNGICSTGACRSVATALSHSFDLTVKPCDNFFKHVCGNFQRDVEFPKTKSQFDKYSMLSEVIIGQIAKILEKDIGSKEPEIFNQIKTYYQSCMNTTSVENRGLEPLQKILSKLGGWPVVLGDAWKDENFTWTDTDELIRSLGYTTKYIFQPYVLRDMNNPSKNNLYIRKLDSRLNDILKADYLIKAYLDYMIDVAVLLGADRSHATKELNETLSFELNLINADKLVDYFTRDMDKDRLTIKELQRLYPYVSWLEYLNNLTNPNFMIDETYEVRLESAVYLVGVQEILANATKKAVANYMIWRVIDDSIDFLNAEIRNKKLSFGKAYHGVSEFESRKIECLDKMIERGTGLLPGISAMYVKNLFKNDTRSKVGKIVSDVYGRYKDVLQNNSWLDDSTKHTVLKKHERMRKIIGYPDNLLDTHSMNKYYGDLYFEPNNYFQNAMTLNNFTYGKQINELGQDPEKNFWIEVGVAANVLIHYHKIYNAMILPAAVLQYPFFDETQPNYINYGGIGSIVGHEITHAYTFEDMPLDENGTQTMWWTQDDHIYFYEKAQCYINHYDNFTSDADRSLTNKLGLNENMADNEGFKIAFDAYKVWKNSHGGEPLLPNMNYTNEQLFWISAASTLCTRRREENRKLQLYTDEHATEELRVNGVMSNMPDFATAFACPVGSPMNPDHKCTFF